MKKILASLMSLFMIVIMLIACITVPAQPTTGSAVRFATERAPDFEFMDTYTTTVQIDAGEKFYIKFDNGTFQLEPMPPEDLPDECDQALGMIPDWMVTNLSYKFRKLDQSHRVELANLIINSPDPNYRDEIGFCIAHLSPEALQSPNFFSQVLTENAQYIYDIEPYLNYVEIVEKSDYTTLNYKNQTNVSLELPRDIYYWYVVHPKLSDEMPTYIDPDHDYTADPPIDERNYGVAPPVGKFWRDWFFNYNDTGYPLLSEYLATCNTVWDAISKCSHWVKDSMSFTSNQERPIQPVRIYRKHIGRCGEHQDIACAAARAALVPTACTLNMAEDHVWNEFWDQRWVRWDANSKDNIDNWNYDTDMGGGKTCSTIWNTRGDSHIYSVLSRYSETCTFTATVLDSNGLPVDGADVWILSDDFYQSGAISITTWGTTDYTGNAVFELGNSRDFWASAESDNLGEDPPDQGGDDYVTKVITDSTPDATYLYTFNLPNAAPSLKATAATPPADAKNTFKLEVSYNVESSITQDYNIFSGEHGDLFGPGGNIDFFIADEYNYIKFVGNNDFETYGLDERGSTNDVSQVLPTGDSWYAVLSNEFAQRTTKIVNITVDIYGSLFAEITSPVDEAELELDSTVTITGTAFGPLGVTNVQIDLDEADNWQSATDSTDGTGNPWSTWSFDWDTSGLSPGLHNIRAKASDGAYTYITSINVTLLDVTAPVVEIDTPANNTEFKIGEVITFEGSATDNVGVVNIQFILNTSYSGGGQVGISGNYNNGVWSLELETDAYLDGEHTLQIWASDTAGNNASAMIYFTLLEVTAPVVTIATPVNNSLYKLGSTIFIRGYATDNNAVNEVLLVIDNEDPVNLTAILNPIDGMWYYLWDTSAEDVYEGEHIIEVQAYDPVRNLGTAQIFVNLDGSPPDASITTPTAGTLFSAGDEIIVQGTAEDDYGVASVELIFDKGKARNITENFMDGEWEYEDWDTEDLKSGEHNITVRVTDLMGLESEVSVLITIDAKLPVVELDEIYDSIQLEQSVTFKGTASDDIGVVILELIIGNDEPINITSEFQEDGTWSYEWNSSGALEGDLGVTAKVTDIVGKKGTAEISLKIISETTDTDEDGMPDWWEIYYGFNPDKDDAERDKDRDGIMNYDEYLGDDGQPGNDDYSDPTDPTSIPAVKSSKSEKEGDLTIIWIILVIVAVIIIVLILFMTIKKKKREEEEMAAGEVLEGEVEVAAVPPMPMPIRPEGVGNVQPATMPPIPIPMMFPIPGMMQQPVQLTPPPESGYAPPPGGYPAESPQPEMDAAALQQPPTAVIPIPIPMPPKIKKMGVQPKIKVGPAGSRLSLPPAGKTVESEKEPEKDKDKIVSDDPVKLLAATMAQSTFDKLRLLKEQGVDVKKAEKYLELSRKALKANNYDKAMEYASKSNDAVEGKLSTEEDEEE